MSESNLIIFSILFLVTAFFLFVSLVSISVSYGKLLLKKGKHEELRRLHRWVYSIVRRHVHASWKEDHASWYMFLQLSNQAEQNLDTEMAVDWARHGASHYFSIEKRIQALGYAAQLQRKQGNISAAQQLEEEALSFGSPMDRANGKFDIDLYTGERARALLCMQIGRFAEAIQSADKLGSRLYPKPQLTMRQLRASAYWQMGHYEKAIVELLCQEKLYQEGQQRNESSFFSTLGKINPSAKNRPQPSWANPAVLMIVQMYLELGRTEEAAQNWTRISQDTPDPDNEAVANAIGAWLAASQGNIAEARRRIEISKAAKTVEDDQSTVDNHIIRTYLALGDYKNAISRLRLLITQNAGATLFQSRCRTFLGECYEGLGNISAAKSEYEQVIAAGFEEAGFTAIARERLKHLETSSALSSDTPPLYAISKGL